MSGKVIPAEEIAVTDGSPKELKAAKLRIMSAITELVEGGGDKEELAVNEN